MQAADELDQEHLQSEGVVCASGWEKSEARCVISFMRLTDPAKGSACKHRACCNYDVLRDYVGRVARGPKECPLATCGARLQRTRDVVRDVQLRALLEQAPLNTTLWLRGEEIRTSDPMSEAAATPRVRAGDTRKSGGASRVDQLSGNKRRRSERRIVIHL